MLEISIKMGAMPKKKMGMMDMDIEDLDDKPVIIKKKKKKKSKLMKAVESSIQKPSEYTTETV